MITKRLEGRDEPILEPDLAVIDSHHHLWDVPAVRYMLDDYVADVRAGHKIVASVYVESRAFARPDGPEVMRPLGEIEFANGVAAVGASGKYGECRMCAAIVGYADLRLGSAIGAYLDAAMQRAPERFRGIRQVTLDHASPSAFRHVMSHRPPAGVLTHPLFREGMTEIASRDLTFDVACYSEQLPDIASLADAFPKTTFALNHTGQVMLLDALDNASRADVLRTWRNGMHDLAKRPNVVCKLSGLGMPFWGFGFETRPAPVSYLDLAVAWKPFVEGAIEAFGANRCMMASNFPPDGRSSGYVPLWNAMKHIVRSTSASEKLALFSGTAARVYRIDIADVQRG